ncbi:hypothetical protein EDC01DRAFT_763208 [Geopyxis carbonaria]|nr:hypothetical protein EDC01DRAFT_763208 [Geopyxis carbonaria]
MQLSILLVLFSAALTAYANPTSEQPSAPTSEDPFESPLPLPGDAPSPYAGIPPTLALDLANGLAPLNLTQEELDAIPLLDSPPLSELDVPNPGEPDPETLDDVDPNRVEIICDTTYASPTFSEIQGLLDLIYSKGIGLYCVQSNMGGSWCTRLFSYKGASASLCGGIYRQLCRKVWLDLQRVRNQYTLVLLFRAWRGGGLLIVCAGLIGAGGAAADTRRRVVFVRFRSPFAGVGAVFRGARAAGGGKGWRGGGMTARTLCERGSKPHVPVVEAVELLVSSVVIAQYCRDVRQEMARYWH